MPDLVFLRHGESDWNKQGRFTGWVDVDLSDNGKTEAVAAGKLLHKRKLAFELAYTSYLRRAVRTLWLVQEQLDMFWLPIKTDWRLNERHYGKLQGLNKQQTATEHGDEQVKIWRRSFATPPPNGSEPLAIEDNRYAGVDVPDGESLKDTLKRALPCWDERIKPDLQAGRNLIVCAHGNSLRALVKHLENISDDDIMQLELPTGKPLHYQLDTELKVVEKNF